MIVDLKTKINHQTDINIRRNPESVADQGTGIRRDLREKIESTTIGLIVVVNAMDVVAQDMTMAINLIGKQTILISEKNVFQFLILDC